MSKKKNCKRDKIYIQPGYENKPSVVYVLHIFGVSLCMCVYQLPVCSGDVCLQVWDLSSGVLLCTFSFSSEVTAVVMDNADYRVFAATLAGRIYQINCFDQVCQLLQLCEQADN